MDRKAYVKRYTGYYTHMRTPEEHYVIEFGLPKNRPKISVYSRELVKTDVKLVTIDLGRKNTRLDMSEDYISVPKDVNTEVKRSSIRTVLWK